MSKKEKPPFVLDGDVIAPREKRERYRIYRVKDGGAPELVATCRTQGSIGVTLCTLGAEGEFLDYCVGVLDGMDHKDSSGEWIGKWLILPWQEDKHEIWNLPEETVQLMTLLGLARRGEDGIHEFTEKGDKWMNDWCAQAIKEFSPREIEAAKKRIEKGEAS
jgi:hypothetical protein